MSKMNNLTRKLSLDTETVRVLSTSELVGVAGGVGDSVQSVCIGNTRGNDTRSAIGYCPTMTDRQTGDGK